MMREQHVIRRTFRERLVPRHARLGFDAAAAFRYSYALGDQRYFQALAQRDAERFPLQRVPAQTVVDVNRGECEAEAGT